MLLLFLLAQEVAAEITRNRDTKRMKGTYLFCLSQEDHCET